MNRKRKYLSLFIIVTLLIGMVGVFNVDPSYAASKKKIHISNKTVSLVVGSSYQQKLLNKKGKTIKAKKVKWKSTNRAIASINKKGKITANGVGTVKMTAKYKRKTYKFTVNVQMPAAWNSYTAGDINMLRLYVGAAAEYADPISSDCGRWASANFFQHSDTYKTYLANLHSDLDEAKEWLTKAQSITGANTPRNCKTQEAISSGFTTWDQMINSLIIECIRLRNTNTSSYTRYSDATEFCARCSTLSELLKVAQKEVSSN